MALRFAFLLLLSVCAFGAGIAAPAFTMTPENVKCGLNQEFQSCGSACVPDCTNQEEPKMCTLQCVIGCFCKKGYLKNSQGECVLPNECDARTPMQLALTENVPTCPENEEFNACGSACAPNCANPHPSARCTKNCVIGCFCKEGHLRNGNGLCVPAHQCEAPSMLFAQEVSQCKENEIFNECGSACAPTCANPHPSARCTKNCVIGCFCKPGFLKNEQGVCVPSVSCGAPVAEAMSIPPQTCGDNEEYRQCKGCDGTCQSPVVICPLICLPGCACKEGHVRNNGKCVLTRECPAFDHVEHYAEAMMMPAQQQCSDNEEYRQCKGCDGTCQSPVVICPLICLPGCACKEGHVRNNGKCVLTRECPAFDHVEHHVEAMMMPAQQQCSDNEEYRQCKGCDGTCDNPNVICPRICLPGCACKQGHVRNNNGKCVLTLECPAFDHVAHHVEAMMMLPPVPKCGEHEVFHPCGTACPATCANPHPSPVCTRNCVIGCFCEEGFLKNSQGVCVAAANCDRTPI